jgi:hypothetical protein
MSSLCPRAALRSRSSMCRAGHPAFPRSALVSVATAFSTRVRWLIVGVGEALVLAGFGDLDADGDTVVDGLAAGSGCLTLLARSNSAGSGRAAIAAGTRSGWWEGRMRARWPGDRAGPASTTARRTAPRTATTRGRTATAIGPRRTCRATADDVSPSDQSLGGIRACFSLRRLRHSTHYAPHLVAECPTEKPFDLRRHGR